MKDPRNKIPQQPLVFLKMDQAGYLINESDTKNIKKPWTDVIEEIKKVLVKYIGNNLHSLYIKGEFTKGKTTKLPSGFWLLVVVKEKIEINWLDEYKQYLLGKFPFINQLLIKTGIYEQVIASEGYTFSIKTEYLCIFGDNIALKSDKIKINSKLCFKCVRLEENIGLWYNFINNNRDNNELIKNTGLGIFIIIVNAGFEICIEREKKYTNDLYTCYKVFSKYYPEKEELMRKAYYITKDPTSDADEIIDLLFSLGKWLVAVIKLNNVEKELKKIKE